MLEAVEPDLGQAWGQISFEGVGFWDHGHQQPSCGAQHAAAEVQLQHSTLFPKFRLMALAMSPAALLCH